MLAQGTSQAVVIRFLDGRTLKGGTHDFAPNRTSFHVQPHDGDKTPTVTVDLASLKAVFFVKTMQGNRDHVEDKTFSGGSGQGRRVRVIFKDDEEVVGFTTGYAPGRPGFFVIPVDPASNNLRIFVVSAAVKKVEWVSAAGPAVAAASR